jgi:hypothetical protein
MQQVLFEMIKCTVVLLQYIPLYTSFCVHVCMYDIYLTNENIYFENYYNEQRKFTND